MAQSDKGYFSADRTLVLKPIEGMKALDTRGLTDPRLFTGENTVHAVMDRSTMLWTIRYAKGLPPPKLRNKYTSFSKLRKAMEDYFRTRNVEIVDVKDSDPR
jgi:hypothetical protein